MPKKKTKTGKQSKSKPAKPKKKATKSTTKKTKATATKKAKAKTKKKASASASSAKPTSKAQGYSMEPVFGLSMEEAIVSPESLVDNLVRASQAEGAEARSFFHQDILKGRRTEVDFINGLVSRKGREAGVPTPMNDGAVELMHELERGDLSPDPVNILRFSEYAND